MSVLGCFGFNDKVITRLNVWANINERSSLFRVPSNTFMTLFLVP